MTSGSWRGLLGARFFLGGALLAAVCGLGASCVEGIGATGYTDAFELVCEQVTRCYGDAFTDCPGRLDNMVAEEAVASASSPPAKDWLPLVEGSGCLDRCDALYRCLDFAPICSPVQPDIASGDEALAPCTIDDDCCGFSTGAALCASGECCRPIGTPCAASSECCANAGECETDPATETRRCGGVACGLAGEDCLNDFQCCSGRCSEDLECEETTCPPEGFACATDADCCDLLCDPQTKRCYDPPECSQQGETCFTAADCCDEDHVCHDGGNPGSGGVCSPEECNPLNVDCFDDEQCCSGFCAPEPYRLCGQCVEEGDGCGPAVPCCTGLKCDDASTCVPEPSP